MNSKVGASRSLARGLKGIALLELRPDTCMLFPRWTFHGQNLGNKSDADNLFGSQSAACSVSVASSACRG